MAVVEAYYLILNGQFKEGFLFKQKKPKSKSFHWKYRKSLGIGIVPLRDNVLQLPKSVSGRQESVHIN